MVVPTKCGYVISIPWFEFDVLTTSDGRVILMEICSGNNVEGLNKADLFAVDEDIGPDQIDLGTIQAVSFRCFNVIKVEGQPIPCCSP